MDGNFYNLFEREADYHAPQVEDTLGPDYGNGFVEGLIHAMSTHPQSRADAWALSEESARGIAEQAAHFVGRFTDTLAHHPEDAWTHGDLYVSARYDSTVFNDLPGLGDDDTRTAMGAFARNQGPLPSR